MGWARYPEAVLSYERIGGSGVPPSTAHWRGGAAAGRAAIPGPKQGPDTDLIF